MKPGDAVLPEPLIVTEVDPLLTTTWGGIRWSTESLTPVTGGPLELWGMQFTTAHYVTYCASTSREVAEEQSRSVFSPGTTVKLVRLIAYVLPQHPAESAEEQGK